MNIDDLVKRKNESELRGILCILLKSYLNPAFGALPKREIDLMFLDSFEAIGVISENPSLYEFVSKLKVTRSKARTLYYDRELRRIDNDSLELKAVEALKHPVLQKQGDLFVFEIENPLVSDHLRHMFQQIGHATDGSFSPSLVKVSADAFVRLLESHLSKDSQAAIKKALVKAGAPDKSFRGVVKGALVTLGKKVASEAGEAVVDHVSDFVAPLWDAASQKVYDSFVGLLIENNEGEQGSGGNA